jgi:uncharacterized low-complexity protein
MKTLSPAILTLGVTLVGATFGVQAGNPFAAQELASGYSLAADEKAKDGSCGEAKCGADMKEKTESKAAEGKCGADKAVKEGSSDVGKAAAEGKCGDKKK